MTKRSDCGRHISSLRVRQEEILWIGEAAHVPVIWPTQVLEHLIKKGTPSRGEMTDAAMAARAECVMLNKGPYLFEAINELDTLLERMDTDQLETLPDAQELIGLTHPNGSFVTLRWREVDSNLRSPSAATLLSDR